MREGLAVLCHSSLQVYSGLGLNMYQLLMREIDWSYLEKPLSIHAEDNDELMLFENEA